MASTQNRVNPFIVEDSAGISLNGLPKMHTRVMSMVLAIMGSSFCSTLAAPGEAVVPTNTAPPPFDLMAAYNIRQWTPANGLPASRVQCLLQTPDGYLWVGTAQGLARFDGTQFKTFGEMNCRCLALDSSGAMWIGTGAGLLCLREGQVHRVPLHPALASSEAESVYAICPRRAGGIWACAGNRLLRVDEGGCELASSGSVGSPTSLLEQSSGGVWVGAMSGTIVWDPVSAGFGATETPPHILAQIVTFVEDSAGGFWVAGGGILGHMDRGSGKIDRLIEPGGAFRLEEAGGDIWAGGELGLWRVRENHLVSMNDARADFGVVSSLLRHGAGGVWVGTENNGLFLLTPKRVQMVTRKEGLAADDAWCVSEAHDGSIWIATHGGASHLVDGTWVNYGTTEGLPTPFATTIVTDQSGRIWVGTESPFVGTSGGVSLFRNGRFETITPGEGATGIDFTSLAPSADGTLWMLGTGRLGAWRAGTFQTIPHPPLEARLAFVDDENDLWLGWKTIWRRHAGQFSKISLPADLESGTKAVVKRDEAGAHWLVSESHGVIRLKDGKFRAITTKDGFFSDLTLSLLEDDSGRYWFNSYSGIFCARKQDLNDVADGKRPTVNCVHYGIEDGMLSVEGNGGNAPNSCRARDGRLWFPTIKGVAVIDPSGAAVDEIPPTVVVEEFRADGEVIFSNAPRFGEGKAAPIKSKESNPLHPSTARNIRVPPGRGHAVHVAFTTTGILFPEKERFRYRLEGRDQDWTEIGNQRCADLNRLPPGAFRFQVKACSARGVWSDRGAELDFEIEPEFYQTWLFYVACGGAVAVALGGLAGYRKRVMLRISLLQQATALANERERIGRDLHDDLGGSLTHVALRLEILRLRHGNDAELDAELHKVSSRARSAIDDMGQIIWSNNPRFDNLASLSAYIREYASEHAPEATRMHCDIDVPEQTGVHLSPEFRRNIFYTVKEALTNVVKHANAKNVNLRMSAEQGWLRIEVVDDGVGFTATSNTSTGMGLNSMRKRVAALRGQITFECPPGSGTRVCITVPIG